ncbi:MAG: TolC family protein [Prevotella sp.]|nr:TolC family protein [Prevotella sp.]
MNRVYRTFITLALATTTVSVSAQFNKSGINAGFFDSSESSQLNFTDFHLPPLAVLYENAKSNPNILILAKQQQIAQAEVAKQKRHIFSYVTGHASYSYGKADMWGNNSSTYSPTLYQFQGTEQSYWNVGVNLAVPVEDILDLKAAVRRKKLEVDRAQLEKDAAFDQLKLQIATLYVKITNDLIALKSASENAAIYQGAGALTQEQFQSGEMSIEAFAETKARENSAVSTYQTLQTQITTDILNLEILTHTPIITNTTTDVTLDEKVEKTPKELEKDHKEFQERLKKEQKEDKKKLQELEKADRKAAKAEKESQEKAEKEAKKSSK